MRVFAGLLLGMIWAGAATAQFEILDAKTTASLRGIDAVNAQVAWASGSGGTVLLTTDGGGSWKHCAVPPGGEKLDFRGVQGFDAKTAVIMASGKGPASAVYKTTDGCETWKLTFADPYPDGFFDGLTKIDAKKMYLMGDPVAGKFEMFFSEDQGVTWFLADDPGLDASEGDGAFAASNSSLMSLEPYLLFGTSASATSPPKVYRTHAKCVKLSCTVEWIQMPIPIVQGGSSRGVFSLAGRPVRDAHGVMQAVMVAVGGDYSKPAEAGESAAYSVDGGEHWQGAAVTPGGYRSAVTYSTTGKTWIAVGPTGTDISRDDGKNWLPLKPGPEDAADADKSWNAISLPFVVGAKGKIGKLKLWVVGR